MSIRHLHDDMLLYMSKDLSAKDSLSLAISGVNQRFSLLYGTNRSTLVLSECYFLSNKSWKRFFKDYISPSSFTVCDVSHCYWLKAKVLLRCITKMPNLEELHMQDTRMSLKKMPQVFGSCQKIKKLSLTLKEDNLDEFKKSVIGREPMKWMKKGFKQITHLKLITFVIPSGIKTNSKAWLAPITVLKWCRDCIDLLISLSYKEPTNGEEDYDVIFTEQKQLWKRLKPRFAWMKTLKNLVILGHYQFRDYFTQQFLDWVRKIQGGRFDLERLWTTEEYSYPFELGPLDFSLVELMNGPTVKSFAMPSEDWEDNLHELDNERFSTLEHLAEIEFHKTVQSFENLTELKYIRGEFYVEDLDEILDCHEKLEQLHVFLKLIVNDEGEHNYILNLRDWELPLLKDLVIWCYGKPSLRLLDHLMKACPNIDRVHFKSEESLSRAEMESFFTSMRFDQLTWLDIDLINLYDGSNLVLIMKNCPKLKKLFLDGNIEANTFFANLSECIPTARNLRDLRVRWPSLQEDLSDLVAFFKGLNCSPTLERLVLYARKDNWKRDPIYNASLQDVILPFVKGMAHLVALGLLGFPIDSCLVEKQFIDEIIPNRPAFWFHLGSELPKASDLSIPRIHYEGIVDPINPYYASPRF